MVGGLGGSNGATRLGRRTVGEAAEKPGSAVCFGRRVDDAVALVGVRREPGHGDNECNGVMCAQIHPTVAAAACSANRRLNTSCPARYPANPQACFTTYLENNVCSRGCDDASWAGLPPCRCASCGCTMECCFN